MERGTGTREQEKQMPWLRVEIVRFVDETQPGVVECEFTDANRRKHRVIDKVPVFSELDLWSDSKYPQPGVMSCKILETARDESGHEIARIGSLETVDGETEFVVRRAQIVDDPSL